MGIRDFRFFFRDELGMGFFGLELWFVVVSVDWMPGYCV